MLSAHLAVVVVGSVALASLPDRKLSELQMIYVTRSAPDEVLVELAMGPVRPPCPRIARDIDAEAVGARVSSVHRGGKGWMMYISPGFPVPMPTRVCKPGVIRLKDVGENVRVRIHDSTTSWTIDLRIPPIPECRMLEPRDKKIAPGDRVQIACDVADIGALKPYVFLVQGPNPRGTRPPIDFAGPELSFIVPDDWQPADQRSAVRLHFSKTTPALLRSDAAKAVSTRDAVGLRRNRDLPVTFKSTR